ncbi:uncharacterized protein PITG_15237 [Phytophthora infestans T30-4]|uniref:Uncharacterized protein n=1 Tax=Phytophthora infestans (strain T30-4) TaxID=403677 RepID=D0NQ78_PHYIT|nr:uncharacterized protein PITG_15237 [Phytophthora infestans T30-4]EEY62810.1 conserved hypothetical protein [Phytophthora infestans T30-4]|eukprot:XP_002898685.1 conserved hypothetical protein [Phytophthora infestans T30-4]
MPVELPKRNVKPTKNKDQLIAKSRTYRIDQKALREDLRRQEKELRKELLRLEKRAKEPSPFARYIHELNTRYYLYTDEVFKATDLSHSHDIDQTVELDGGVKFFYPRSKLALPSSVSETSNTLWKLGEHLFNDKQSYVQHHNVEDSNNTLVVSFTDTNVLETGDTVQISHWYVARRFIQDKRVVIGWKHIFQGEGILCGLKEDETGWCLRPT